jgi:hypothetical protein
MQPNVPLADLCSRLKRDGVLRLSGWLPADALEWLRRAVEIYGDARAGVRQPRMVEPSVRALLGLGSIRDLMTAILGPRGRSVRTILFDKTGAANWAVPWHQDRTIAVNRRAALAGFRHWTVKGGVTHVEPPIELLENMVTLRIHLDPADADRVALQVLPGSHRLGRLTRPEIQALAKRTPGLLCTAEAGDIVVMRPLLVHRSGKASHPGRRRVLHLELSADQLPPPLAWAFAESANPADETPVGSRE